MGKNWVRKDNSKREKMSILNTLKTKFSRKKKTEGNILMTNHKKSIKWYQKIRTKLVGGFMIPVIFMIILGSTVYMVSSKAIVDKYEKSTLATVEKVSDYFEIAMKGVQSSAVQLVNNNSLKNYYGKRYSYDFLKERKEINTLKKETVMRALTDRFINEIYIFGDYGDDVASTGMPKNTYAQYMESDDAQYWKDNKELYQWTGYHTLLDSIYKLDSEKYGISITYQMEGKKGFLIMDIDMNEIMKSLEEIQVGEGIITGFISPDGREVLYNTEDKVYFSNRDFYKQMISSEESGFSYQMIDGEKMLVLYSNIGDTGSTTCVAIPEKLILKEVSYIKLITILMVIIASVVAIIVGLIFSSGISKVTGKLMLAMERAAGGDMNVALTIKRKDEFGILGKSFDTMMESVGDLISKVAEVSESVSESAFMVTNDSEEILKASRNITNTISEIEIASTNQAEDTLVCTGQMSDLDKKIEQVSNKILEIRNLANGTTEIAEKGRTMVNDLNIKSKATRTITDEITVEITNLTEEIKKIYKIVDLIIEIGEQTRLLSLNASIEAARAGENGKGFSVVAVEIRNLADQSVESVEMIQQIIASIQTRIEKTVHTSGEVGYNMQAQENSLKNTIEVFGEISQSLFEQVEQMSQISTSIDAVENIKKETMDAIEGFSAIAQENAASTEEITETSKQQLASVEQLAKTADKLMRNEKDLKIRIQKFKF